MKLRAMRNIFIAIVFVCLLCGGCGEGNNSANALPKLQLVTYTGEDAYHWDARKLEVNLADEKISVGENVIFQIFDEKGWSDCVFPIEMTDNLLVLRGETTKSEDRRTVICEREEYMGEYQIWNGEDVLTYNPKEKTATFERNGEDIAALENMQYDGIALYPIAFFVDDDDKLVIMCERGDEEALWNEHYPVSVVASKTDDLSKKYSISQTNSFEKLLEDDFSQMNLPYRTWFDVNVYADNETKSFLWNETQNIVKMNPYNSEYEIILTEKDVEENMKFLDTQKESYAFFNGFAVQEDVYIAMFPSYNDLAGTYAAFFNREGDFLGCVLCTESSITYLNKQGEETDKIEMDKLKGMLYAG